MELVDLSPESRIRPPSVTSAKKSQFMVLIQKYSQTIFWLETAVIIVLISLLLFWNSLGRSLSPRDLIGNDTKSPDRRTLQWPAESLESLKVFVHEQNRTEVLIGVDTSCNRRKHDYKLADHCFSSGLSSCRAVSERLPVVNNQTPSKALEATIITTSKSGLKLREEQVELVTVDCSRATLEKNDCKFKTRLVVQPEKPQQKIIGWGGALTDSSLSNILSLTNGTRRLLDDYFGDDGLRYNMIRVTMGGSDFSTRFYTNDDLQTSKNSTNTTDFAMNAFKLREEDLLYKIPLIKFIQGEFKTRPLKLFASMWSPPVWMKTNEHFNQGSLKGSIRYTESSKATPDELYFKALADLKVKFLLAYREQSINFWGLTVMNEPLFAVQPFLNFNTMIFPKLDYAHYISRFLGPALRNDKRLEHLKLMVHDDNKRYLSTFTEPVLETKRVIGYLDGVSVHGYTDEEYDQMDQVYQKYKSKRPGWFVLPTELCSGHLPWMQKALVGNWHRGVHYALDIIRSLQHSAAGWVDWNMVLDSEGGPGWLKGRLDSAVIVDRAGDFYSRSPMFYVLGQFSRYVPPESVKVNSIIVNDDFDHHFETVTFKLPNSNKLATVVLNNNPYEVELNIRVVHDKDSATGTAVYRQVKCKSDSVTTIIYSDNSQ